MATEVIPVGAPELGMSRAEMIDAAWAAMEILPSVSMTRSIHFFSRMLWRCIWRVLS